MCVGDGSLWNVCEPKRVQIKKRACEAHRNAVLGKCCNHTV